MEFSFEQSWKASVDDVVAVYLDESFWSTLSDLSTTTPPEVLSIERTDESALVRLHWVLSVDLPSQAARFIDPDDVAWIEETHWDLRSRSAQVSFIPDQAAGLLRVSASASLALAGGQTVRTINGDLEVRIPLLGRKVEPAIVDGVRDHLAEETRAVAARLGD